MKTFPSPAIFNQKNKVAIKFIFLIFIISNAAYANIYGKDQRIEHELHPLSQFAPIVKVSINLKKKNEIISYSCTGSLIAKDLVLTADHCIQHTYNEILVSVGYRNQNFWKQTTATVINGKDKNYFNENDWVLLKTKEPLGEKFGYFKISKEPYNILSNQNIYFISYSSDYEHSERLSFQKCNIHKTEQAFIYHDCAASFGSSGGALLNCKQDFCTILGIHIMSLVPMEAAKKEVNVQFNKYEPTYPNVAISAQHILEQMKDIPIPSN